MNLGKQALQPFVALVSEVKQSDHHLSYFRLTITLCVHGDRTHRSHLEPNLDLDLNLKHDASFVIHTRIDELTEYHGGWLAFSSRTNLGFMCARMCDEWYDRKLSTWLVSGSGRVAREERCTESSIMIDIGLTGVRVCVSQVERLKQKSILDNE